MDGELEAVALLEAAHSELQEYVIPNLSGEGRYRAMLVARTIRMVARELVQADARKIAAIAEAEAIKRALEGQRVSDKSFIAAIRSGKCLDDTALHHALWARAVVDVSVTKPSALSRIELRMAGLSTLIED